MVWNLKQLASKKLTSSQYITDKEINVNNEINKLYKKSLLISGSIGSFAILLYYLPCDLWPVFFNYGSFTISLFGASIDIQPVSQIYNVICLILELYALGLVHIYLVKQLSKITQFPNEQNPLKDLHKDELVKISLENFNSKEKEIGLNPYYGLSKSFVISLLIFNKAKAFLSNAIIKIVFQKFAGRYVLRLYTDLLGMPIYFFWNAYATREVFLRAKYYMLSQNLIDLTTEYVVNKHGNNDDVKKILYELLQLISIKKRTFSSSHYVFSIKLLQSFDVPVLNNYTISNNFIEHLKKLPESAVHDILLLFVTGMLIDGNLSKREIKEIKKIKQEINSSQPILELCEEYETAFKNGQGETFVRNFFNMIKF
jgi:hypothetical protein